MLDCKNCDSTGWVCENHDDTPWDGHSDREDACGCGAGMPCPVCVPAGEWPKDLPGMVTIWSIWSEGKTVH
jgi:hypothetical protein